MILDPKSARTASIDSPNVYKAGKNDQESNKELILEDEINKLRVARIQLDKEFLETLNKDMRVK